MGNVVQADWSAVFSNTRTITRNTVAGRTLVACVLHQSQTSGVVVTDSAGGSSNTGEWVRAATTITPTNGDAAATSARLCSVYVRVGAPATTSVTASMGASNGLVLHVLEVADVTGVRAAASANNGTFGYQLALTAQAGDVVIGQAARANSQPGNTAAGYTQAAGGNISTTYQSVSYQTAAATGSTSPQWDGSGTTGMITLVLAGAVTARSGSASGTLAWTGTASGSTTRRGSASGALAFTGTASGTTVRRGSATGALAFAGTASGSTARRGSASGSLAWVGTASGSAPSVAARSGSASGVLAWSGTASGSTVRRGSAAGALAWAGTASGRRATSGSAAGELAWSGVASGRTDRSGSAFGDLSWVGTASGSSRERRDLSGSTVLLVDRARASLTHTDRALVTLGRDRGLVTLAEED